jgi:hypothetical protein
VPSNLLERLERAAVSVRTAVGQLDLPHEAAPFIRRTGQAATRGDVGRDGATGGKWRRWPAARNTGVKPLSFCLAAAMGGDRRAGEIELRQPSLRKMSRVTLRRL